MNTLPEEIIRIIYKKYYSYHVLYEFEQQTNKFLFSTYFFNGLKQMLYFEKDIKEDNTFGNTRKHVIYDDFHKKCFTVEYNYLFQGYEQAPNKSFKEIVFN